MKRWLWIILLLMSLWFYLTGEKVSKNERDVMLVTDIRQLMADNREAEFSHTQVLVLHGSFLKKHADAIRRHRELSYDVGIVVTGETEPVSEKVGKKTATITDQMRRVEKERSITLSEFLRVYYDGGHGVLLPLVAKKDGKIVKIGTVMYGTGKSRLSFR